VSLNEGPLPSSCHLARRARIDSRAKKREGEARAGKGSRRGSLSFYVRSDNGGARVARPVALVDQNLKGAGGMSYTRTPQLSWCVSTRSRNSDLCRGNLCGACRRSFFAHRDCQHQVGMRSESQARLLAPGMCACTDHAPTISIKLLASATQALTFRARSCLAQRGAAYEGGCEEARNRAVLR
jgi:hypothetical protein